MSDMQTKDIKALIEQHSDRRQSSEETAAGAILKRAGGKRMLQEEFDKHFGHLPTDGEG
ncbi:MAG TPA: hypothetical protein VFJ64_00390 [Solirubrobacterales bacterium]|nr:hypothetical protein [Solirubrobacterales bacterium]